MSIVVPLSLNPAFSVIFLRKYREKEEGQGEGEEGRARGRKTGKGKINRVVGLAYPKKEFRERRKYRVRTLLASI
jgi:hypothetical protein